MIKVLGNKSYGNQINTLASRGNSGISVSRINTSGSTSGGYSKPGVESIDLSAKRQQERINVAHQSVIDKFKQLKSQAESRMFGSKTGRFNVTRSNLSHISDGSSAILGGMSAGVNATTRNKISGTTFYTTRGNGPTSFNVLTGNRSLGAGLNPTLTTTNASLGNGTSVYTLREREILHSTAPVRNASYATSNELRLAAEGNGSFPSHVSRGNGFDVRDSILKNESSFGNGASLQSEIPIGNAARVNSADLDYAVAKVHVDPTTGRVTPATAGNASGAVLEAASAGVHNESFTSYGNNALGYEQYSAKEVVAVDDARKFTSNGNGALGYQGFSSTNSLGEGAAAGAATGVNGVNSALGNGSLGASYNPMGVAGNAPFGTSNSSNLTSTIGNVSNGAGFSSTNSLGEGAAAGTSTGVNSVNSVLGNSSLGASYNPMGVVGNTPFGTPNSSNLTSTFGNVSNGGGFNPTISTNDTPDVTDTPATDTPVADNGTPTGDVPTGTDTPVVTDTPSTDPSAPTTDVPTGTDTPVTDPGTPTGTDTPTVDPTISTSDTPVVNPGTPSVDPSTPVGGTSNNIPNIPISGGAGGAGGNGGAGGSVTVQVPNTTGTTTTTGTTATTAATAGTVTDSYNTNVSNSGNTYYNYSNNIQGNNFGTQSGGTTVNNYYNGGQGQSAPVSPAGFVNPQVQTPSINVGGGSSTPASVGTTIPTTSGTDASGVSSTTPVETVSTPVADASNNASATAFINKEGIAASASPTSGWGSMTGFGVAGGAAVATAGVMAMPSNVKPEEVEDKLNKEDQKNEQFRQAISQQFGQANNTSSEQTVIETIN